jgi:hypothetical protein
MSIKRTVATVAGDVPATVLALDYDGADPVYVITGLNTSTHPGWMGQKVEELSFVIATDAVDDNDDRGGVPAEALYEILLDRLGDTPADLGTSFGEWLAAKVTATDITQGDADDIADAIATAIGGTYTP